MADPARGGRPVLGRPAEGSSGSCGGSEARRWRNPPSRRTLTATPRTIGTAGEPSTQFEPAALQGRERAFGDVRCASWPDPDPSGNL